MNREEIYIAGLMNDIGKLLNSKNDNYDYVNKLKSILKNNQFFQKFNNSLLKEIFTVNSSQQNMVESVFFDKGEKSLSQKIIDAADFLSTSNKEDLKDKDSLQLRSIFTEIFKKENNIDEDYFYPTKKLDLNNIFPVKKDKLESADLDNLIINFLNELKNINREEQLYFLLEKYFWSVPASKSQSNSDISLFDHSKTKAAIAISLYDQYKAEKITESELEDISNFKKDQFILLNGDLSGIQDFIFNIPSKKASKSLKGRSMYLNLLLDIIVKYIVEELDLKESNILYNGGGNFYILAPESKKEDLNGLKTGISKKLLAAHQGDLYLAVDSICFAPHEFDNFTELWGKVKIKVESVKHRKWNEVGLKDNFNKIFGPLDQGTAENDHCHICGVSNDIRKLDLDKSINENNENQKICSLCESFIDLTDDLKDANYLSINKTNNNSNIYQSYNDVLSSFGYYFSFSSTLTEFDNIYKLNDTNFMTDNCSGFKFGAYNLPQEDHRQITFEELAENSIENGNGDKKLGVLKLDVDNLGAIFTKGLESDRSIARVTSLSRMMGLFYEGYINRIITENNWDDKIYVVFSGGDDTFIVGSWNVILDFAEKFYKKFREYTCYNKYITFSAGLGVFKHNYPINRSAHLTEDYLDEAKTIDFNRNDDVVPIKNKINFLGETFNWEELKRIKSIKDLLYDLVINKGYGKGILRKVHKSTLGFKNILEDSTRGIYRNIKLWRLSYYLREVKENDEEAAEKLLNEYESIVIHNLTGKSEDEMINNIMIIPAAVKWTEMATRNFKEG
ncbi:type III-A CRISPR-associated protein Cas10/Csm1 [Halanaerobium congolense]|jgi:CRISPR-associated protein Csm1|uniref:CRISPR system single-strand-specific deoxyribonuclease Cas10/Csm1 (subtype III-A) n=1 Tax=Halanaerobium congolense TaxID=54121 RepID=A0A1G6SAP5_9FIRM|nr:type III-A CRISPR-associated protein Cas10/Csm1 [Halanaerobium congolense]SDD13286.1 CRISPR-associated protein Cas10/Csm1, subtype III-A/MTUBE [Halanaerobium congolense]SHN10045.1 CRISPR-associated protein Cas10/Csm1, subtype III-A/MTUBE [Halanaerobium congolense]